MKIHFEELQERLDLVEGENKKLGSVVEKLRKKDIKEAKEGREERIKDKENERHGRILKKKEEDNPKTARGRSTTTTTMVRDKSRVKLREDWEMTENIDLTNHNLVAKLKKSKNLSKSKTHLR